MFRSLLIVLLIMCAVVDITASDSLKAKPKKFLIDLNYGQGVLRFEKPNQNYLLNADPALSFNIKSINVFEGSFLFCFNRTNSRGKARAFYVGLNYAHTIFDISSGYNDYYESGQFPYRYHFSDGMLNTTNPMNSFGLLLSMNRNYHRFFISHKIGLRYAMFAQRNITKTYTQVVSKSSPDTSPLYVTAENPQGWYWVHSSWQYTQTNSYTFENSLNPFYQFSGGVRFGIVYLYAGLDLSLFGNTIGFETSRYPMQSFTFIKRAVIGKLEGGISIAL